MQKKKTNKQDRYNKFISIINAALSIRRYDKIIAHSITYNIDWEK